MALGDLPAGSRVVLGGLGSSIIPADKFPICVPLSTMAVAIKSAMQDDKILGHCSRIRVYGRHLKSDFSKWWWSDISKLSSPKGRTRTESALTATCFVSDRRDLE